jgi:hypothetical protein
MVSDEYGSASIPLKSFLMLSAPIPHLNYENGYYRAYKGLSAFLKAHQNKNAAESRAHKRVHSSAAFLFRKGLTKWLYPRKYV